VGPWVDKVTWGARRTIASVGPRTPADNVAGWLCLNRDLEGEAAQNVTAQGSIYTHPNLTDDLPGKDHDPYLDRQRY